jgi:hypothetical protein
MKRLFYSVFVTVLFSLSALAQNEGINFQGVARNAAGEVLVSQKINLRLSILLGSETGAVAYMETRQVTTNPQGVFAVVVGDDKALTKSINFSTINWTPAPKFIKVEMDSNAGTNYIVMGTSRLQAVPFAFYAYGVEASNVKGVLPLSSGGTGVASMTELKSSLGLDVFNNAALETKVDKVAGKGLSTNDYTTTEKNKLEAITGTNTGDQDLSGYATTAQLATKANASDVTTSLATKANAADVTTSLATKANAADVTTSLAAKANASDMTTSLATKVDKVSGKVLSTNDYTTVEKDKLAAITGTNTGDQVNITGNAGTATKLQNARTINGVAFDGSANITLPAAASGIPYTGATQAVNLGAFNLTVNGMTIGRGLNTGPDTNSAFGKSALASNTGFGNTATGFNALSRNTSGAANTATGWEALGLNTTGKQNAAFGWQVLYKNTGDFNTGAGESALKNNTSGNGNSAFGQDALANNSTGTNNTAIGRESIASNTTGSNNTAIGALSSVGSFTNATAIGYQATATADNTIQLGNTAVTDVITSGSITAGKDIIVSGVIVGRGAGNLTTSNNNVAIGTRGLAGTGTANTAVGNDALIANTSGGNNVSIGSGSLFTNTTGGSNVAIGFLALWKNTTGSNNTANGREALKEFVGSNNTAIGYRALWGVNGASTGTSNTAVGSGAGNAITTGSNNIAIGGGDNVATGSNNTLIGVNAKVFTSSFSDATVIGYTAYASGSNATAIGNGAVAAANTIQLGNASVVTIGGQVNWTGASDSRIKKNIVNSTYGLATVLKLRPVEYNLTSNDLKQVGFIAQEVQKLVPEVVTGKEGDLSKGEILGITYSNLVPVLTKAIQEQQKQIEEQNSKIASQQKQIEELIKLVKGQ